jgi:hypothetical protein
MERMDGSEMEWTDTESDGGRKLIFIHACYITQQRTAASIVVMFDGKNVIILWTHDETSNRKIYYDGSVAKPPKQKKSRHRHRPNTSFTYM